MSASSIPTGSHDSVLPDRGDFVDSEDECEIEDESEDSTQYLVGYFYPVLIGDVFKERYQVVHKLGRGGFSTVWLAYDRQTGEDVALKILCSTTYASQESETHLEIAKRIRDRTRVVLCQDSFVLSRMDGETEYRHTVLVLPLRGPSLESLLTQSKRPLADRMSAAKQLLQAVLSIHDAGLVHRGKLLKYSLPSICRLLSFVLDIVLPNIVCGLKMDLSKLSTAYKYKLLSRPRKARALIKDDQVVGELVVPAKFPPEIVSSGIFLCDFGISINAGTSVTNKLQSPLQYCAPELFHNVEPSFASDMWSYMVVFLYLYTEKLVFSGARFAGKLRSIVEHTGVLPLEWKDRYNAPDKDTVVASWYGHSSQSKDMLSGFLDKHRPDISAKEKALALSVIQRVFRPRPEERIGASDLLNNKDFKALMRLYGI